MRLVVLGLCETEVAEDVLSIVKHGLNSLVVLVDVLVSARPYRLLHFYQVSTASFQATSSTDGCLNR